MTANCMKCKNLVREKSIVFANPDIYTGTYIIQDIFSCKEANAVAFANNLQYTIEPRYFYCDSFERIQE